MCEYSINISNTKQIIDTIKINEYLICSSNNLKKLFTNNFTSGKFVKDITINTSIEKIIPSILKDVIILKKNNGNLEDYIDNNYTRIFDIIYVLDYIGFNDYLDLVKIKLPNIINNEKLLSNILNVKIEEFNPVNDSIYSWVELVDFQ